MRRPVATALRLRRALRATFTARRTPPAPAVAHIVADLDELDTSTLDAAIAWRRRTRLRT